jgi:hypothetical protein
METFIKMEARHWLRLFFAATSSAVTIWANLYKPYLPQYCTVVPADKLKEKMVQPNGVAYEYEGSVNGLKVFVPYGEFSEKIRELKELGKLDQYEARTSLQDNEVIRDYEANLESTHEVFDVVEEM